MTNVVRAMMASDPSGRASCMELLEFAWFQESLICSITDAQQVRTYVLLFTVRTIVYCTFYCLLYGLLLIAFVAAFIPFQCYAS